MSIGKLKGIGQAIAITIEIDVVRVTVAIGIDGVFANVCGIILVGFRPSAIGLNKKLFEVATFIRIGNRIAIGVDGITGINPRFVLLPFDDIGNRIAIAIGIHVIGNRIAIAIDRCRRGA